MYPYLTEHEQRLLDDAYYASLHAAHYIEQSAHHTYSCMGIDVARALNAELWYESVEIDNELKIIQLEVDSQKELELYYQSLEELESSTGGLVLTDRLTELWYESVEIDNELKIIQLEVDSQKELELYYQSLEESEPIPQWKILTDRLTELLGE